MWTSAYTTRFLKVNTVSNQRSSFSQTCRSFSSRQIDGEMNSISPEYSIIAHIELFRVILCATKSHVVLFLPLVQDSGDATRPPRPCIRWFAPLLSAAKRILLGLGNVITACRCRFRATLVRPRPATAAAAAEAGRQARWRRRRRRQ